MFLLSGMFQGNLKIYYLFPSLCVVVCFVLKIKVTLSDGIFYQLLSLPVGHIYEVVRVVIFQPHGCIRLLLKLVIVCNQFLCSMLCGSNLVFRQMLSYV